MDYNVHMFFRHTVAHYVHLKTATFFSHTVQEHTINSRLELLYVDKYKCLLFLLWYT